MARRTRVERELREAQRPALENRVIREVGPDGTRDTGLFDANPDWFVPRESRFFAAWDRSSAAADRIFAHWAFDIYDLENRGRREIGFIPAPQNAD